MQNHQITLKNKKKIKKYMEPPKMIVLNFLSYLNSKSCASFLSRPVQSIIKLPKLENNKLFRFIDDKSNEENNSICVTNTIKDFPPHQLFIAHKFSQEKKKL